MSQAAVDLRRYQTDEPLVKHLSGWVCLHVNNALWVWFQVRPASKWTYLRLDVIKALGSPEYVTILGKQHYARAIEHVDAGRNYRCDHCVLGTDISRALFVDQIVFDVQT